MKVRFVDNVVGGGGGNLNSNLVNTICDHIAELSNKERMRF